MAARLITKKSTVAAKVPLATDLEIGELAVNTADAKLYTKHSDGTIKQLGGDAASSFFSLVTVTATSSGQTSFTIPGGYTPGAVVVFLEGAQLAPAHYTATSGTDVVLASGAGVIVGTELVVLRLSAFEVADALPLAGTATDSTRLGGQVPAHYLDFSNRTGAPAAVAFSSVDILVPDGTVTDLTFDTIVFDNANCLNLSTSNKLMTVPATGLYLLWCSSDFEGGTGVSGIANTRVSLADGSPYLLVSSPYSSTGSQMSGSGLAYLTAGAQLKMSIFHLTGSARKCRGFLWANRFGIARVG